MNRRKFFAAMAGAPLAAVVADKAQAAPAIDLRDWRGRVVIPLGYVVDETYYWAGSYGTTASGHHHPIADPGHCHAFIAGPIQGIPITRRKIFDGERFVDFDGPEGTKVINRMLQNRG